MVLERTVSGRETSHENTQFPHQPELAATHNTRHISTKIYTLYEETSNNLNNNSM